MTRNCTGCNAELNPRPRAHRHAFCSKTCAKKYHRRQERERIGVETRWCKHCQTPFNVGPNQGNQKFCSVPCREDSHRPVAGTGRGRPVLCIKGCGRRRLFVISKLCEPCHLAENPEDAAPMIHEPLRHLFEATCLLCARGEFFSWSAAELMAQHGTRFCGHCGGRVLIDRADIGNPGSPMLGHTTGYKSLAVMGRKAG